MSLEAYRGKRNASETPEPTGGRAPGKGESAAPCSWSSDTRRGGCTTTYGSSGTECSRLGRAERGPTDAGERHLAVHVEDHPLEYATFEGEIPAGQYGAGRWRSSTQGPMSSSRRSGTAG